MFRKLIKDFKYFKSCHNWCYIFWIAFSYPIVKYPNVKAYDSISITAILFKLCSEYCRITLNLTDLVGLLNNLLFTLIFQTRVNLICCLTWLYLPGRTVTFITMSIISNSVRTWITIARWSGWIPIPEWSLAKLDEPVKNWNKREKHNYPYGLYPQ